MKYETFTNAIKSINPIRKTKILKSILTVAGLLFMQAFAQTIAVAPIKTYGVFATKNTATTLTRLELIKLNKYAVLDAFDMNEIANPVEWDSCFGKTCLVEYGKTLGVDYVVSGSIDGLGNKIVITIKMIDVKQGMIASTQSMEFDNQESELQRMLGIVLQEMHGITPDAELVKRLTFNNEMIVSSNVGRVNNSGPRMGVAYATGTMEEFLTRPEYEGGLDIQPLVTNIGYQFEGQYVGTENFSALVEGLVMFTGIEQGKFLPSFSLLNGFRFGRSGWEFAFGPSFGLSKTSHGFFDTGNHFGVQGKYWSSDDFYSAGYDYDVLPEYGYEFTKTLDTRGDLAISTRWIMAFGRTFRSGALNIPVNVFYSSQKGGGLLGASIGFNIVRSKSAINAQ